jgi:hypothetical protein
MATPIGAILCVGMLGLGCVLLILMAVASAFVVIPVDSETGAAASLHEGRRLRIHERHYSTAV